jgi:hypothetical protein
MIGGAWASCPPGCAAWWWQIFFAALGCALQHLSGGGFTGRMAETPPPRRRPRGNGNCIAACIRYKHDAPHGRRAVYWIAWINGLQTSDLRTTPSHPAPIRRGLDLVVAGAGAGPRGQFRLAACPGVPQGALPVSGMPWALGIGSSVAASVAAAASRGSNHFAFPSLADRIVQVSSPVRFLGASPLGAPTTSSPTTRRLPQPHRPIEFFANNFFDCRHRGSLAASTQVNRAPRVRHPPSIFSTYAPRLERVLLTRGDGVLHIKISGSLSNLFCW